MANLSRKLLQELLIDHMKQTRNKRATMAGMEMFYNLIMEKRPDCKKMKPPTFRKFVRGCSTTVGSWIAMRHEADGTEIFYLTVKLCPMDKSKINRILCSWLNRDHRCG